MNVTTHPATLAHEYERLTGSRYFGERRDAEGDLLHYFVTDDDGGEWFSDAALAHTVDVLAPRKEAA